LATLAEESIGDFYFKGDGVPQDYTEARRWYLKAADQGEPNSQLRLGVMFDRGLGVAPDPVQAYAWFVIVANNVQGTGVGGAQVLDFATKHRDSIAPKMTAEQLVDAERLVREVWVSRMHQTGFFIPLR